MVFTIYGRGGHLGHVTWILRPNFRLPYPWMLYIKFQLDWPSSFREEDHPRVIISTNYDGLESQMLHTKFRVNRPAGSGEEDF